VAIVAETNPQLRDWRSAASCQEEDPELFFPEKDGRSKAAKAAYDADVAEAKTVCAGCDVLAQCRAWALDVRPSAGIFGGLTEDERNAILAGNAGAAAGQDAA
jgi:WhiB family transcriptional regulator, redox-sensing transcriptional regulator